MDEPSKPNSIFLQHLLASSLASGTARLLTHPFDTIRTRLQIYHQSAPASISPAIGINPKMKLSYIPIKATFTTGRNIIIKEGVRSLYSGVGIAMAIGAPALSTYLFTYDLAKGYISSKLNNQKVETGQEGLATHLLAAVTAEVISGLFWTPMEVIKQRMQAAGGEDRRYKSSRHAIKKILQIEGVRGLYRGYFTTLSVFIPQSSLFFTSYEQMKLLALKYFPSTQTINEEKQQKTLSFPLLLGISFLASAFSAAVTNPLDILKTRWQVQIDPSVSDSKTTKSSSTPWLGLAYKSPTDIALRVIREEGLGALTNGMVARVLWMAPSTAISMACYEMLKSIL